MAAPQGVLDELRLRIGSPSAAELPDAQLSSFLEGALRGLSRYRPREATATVSLLAGVSIYDLPEGCRGLRRLYHLDVTPPVTDVGPGASGDRGLSAALAGISPAGAWPVALDSRSRDARDLKLYGGDWYIEAGKLVVAPAPGSAADVMAVYPAAWTWADLVDVDSYGAVETVLRPDEYEDLFAYGCWQGLSRLSAARGKIRSVTRVGQQTVFGGATAESSEAETHRLRWVNRVERARVGPTR